MAFSIAYTKMRRGRGGKHPGSPGELRPLLRPRGGARLPSPQRLSWASPICNGIPSQPIATHDGRRAAIAREGAGGKAERGQRARRAAEGYRSNGPADDRQLARARHLSRVPATAARKGRLRIGRHRKRVGIWR